jgi:hypothetical protein
MDNVIPFPKKINQSAGILNIEEVDEKISQLKYHHINEALVTVIPMLFSYLETAGFDFTSMDEENLGADDPNIKDAAFMVEAIRSLLCKHHDIDHPFQQISENVFEKDLTNNGMFSIVKKMNIQFENLEKGNS